MDVRTCRPSLPDPARSSEPVIAPSAGAIGLKGTGPETPGARTPAGVAAAPAATAIDCRRLDELLADLLSGALAAEQRADCDRHLAHCASCAHHVATYACTVRLVRQAFPPCAPPPDLLDRIESTTLLMQFLNGFDGCRRADTLYFG
ncbi:MAG: zf-HC2 domain-containing protein [Planctomycetes bacterium]|nr:zf-HC2 domain-containing protein [Planctomycetota bacterium]